MHGHREIRCFSSFRSSSDFLPPLFSPFSSVLFVSSFSFSFSFLFLACRSATAVMDMSIVLNSKAFYSMYTMQEHHLPLTDDVPGMENRLSLSLSRALFSSSYQSLLRLLFFFFPAISSVLFFSAFQLCHGEGC